MTDTTKQAALPDLPNPPLRFGINTSATGQRLDYSAEDMRAYATLAIASLTAERDELRAALLAVRDSYRMGRAAILDSVLDQVNAALKEIPHV